MTFEEWWETVKAMPGIGPRESYRQAWDAATGRERDRCVRIADGVWCVVAGYANAFDETHEALVAVVTPAPAPLAVREVRVGFRWCFQGHVYEIVCIDETMCRYVCVDAPHVTHGGLDGAEEPNWQSVGRTIREANGP